MSARKGHKYVGWVPFLCVLAAIALLATSAITWVISPNWGDQTLGAAQIRNVGTVPTTASVKSRALSPNRIVIPRLRVRAPVVPVDVSADRELQIPEDPKVVGWWRGGAKPGARKGTAILSSHINYAGVEGALANIGKLDPGDKVFVYGTRNGKRVKLTFKVTGVRSYVKKALPYQEIFDQTSVGRLALVTCGGPFDASTGNYLDNIVVFAVPV